MQMLVEVVSAADQENKRKQPRGGSVPPRATTPVNSTKGYVPGVKTGVVTPAVRTSSQMACQSVPNKRQRLGDSSSSGVTPVYSSSARAPLGTHRGENVAGGIARAASPTKIPTKTPTSGPRSATLAMVVPKPGTQHHSLGHGRVPSTVIYGAGVTGVNSYRSASSGGGYGRVPSTGYTKGAGQAGVMKKATRARRESFKPRPSMDNMDLGVSIGASGGPWSGGYTVKEEDEY